MLNQNKISKSVTVALWAIVILFLSVACSRKKPQVSNEIVGDDAPTLLVEEMTTLVSDSGVTRYRISTKTWLVFEQADSSYWDFPDGLHLESFDPQMNTEAKIDCRRAKYFEKRKLWQLDDSVRAMNYEGNHFATQQLFWDQNTERIYSDSLITIEQADRIIIGEGFESNQSMTRYTIRKTRGIIPVDTSEE